MRGPRSIRSMALEVDEIGSLSKLERRGAQFEEVFAASDERDIFTSLSWLTAWWRTYGEGRKMRVLEISEHGSPVGYAPLMSTTIGKVLRLSILEFIGTGQSDRLGILAVDGRKDVHSAAWKHMRESGRWDTIDLRDMREDGSTVAALLEGMPEAEKETTRAPFIPILGEHRDYLSGLSSNARHNLGRLWHRLVEEKGARVEAFRDPSDMDFCYRTLLELNAMRWKTIGVSTLAADDMKAFVRLVLQEHARKGQVVFHMILVKDAPIAITYGFAFDNRYLYYLSGFNPEYSTYGPGKVLLSKIIEYCYAEGFNEMDLLRGDEPYKYSFNPIDRTMYRVKVSGKGLKGSISDHLRNG